MKFSLNWLHDYIDPDLTPTQIGKVLTSAGLEVEGIHHKRASFSNVVVGRVLHTEKHPNADKLTLATVTDGTDTFQLVCGAPNCREGLKTAFAKIGATLTDTDGKTITLKPTKIRGVESFGMLCSAKELQIGDDDDGIIEFGENIKEGSDIAALHEDTTFDVSLTPNLGHCASLIGIARELSAITSRPINHPKSTPEEAKESPISNTLRVTIEDKKKCPRYASRVIDSVKVAPSPDWLKRRLESCDVRSINNVVDVTNYVLLELGHPLHAFDYAHLDGGELIVRSANEGESFITLDGQKRILSAGDLVICDKSKPVALAGVMGGQNSEVTETTTKIVLEAAYFDPPTIRKTSKRLGISSEASKHFERGCDPNNVIQALDRAADLIQKLAGGTISSGIIDLKDGPFPEKVIDCRVGRTNQILGTQLSISEIENIFQRLGFSYRWNGKDAFSVTVPTYRVDITAEIDLIEEVARTYGYDKIRKPDAVRYCASTLPHAPLFVCEQKNRSRLLAEGLQELLTCDLIGPTLLSIVHDNLMPEASLIKVLNPTSVEQSILRTSLLPGLLQVVKHNFDHQNHDVSGFEIGRVHFKDNDSYNEQSLAGIILTGKSAPHHWENKPQAVDFFVLKGILEGLFKELGIDNVLFKPSTYSTLHSGRQAAMYVNDIELGSMGEVHPAIQRRLDVPQRIYFAEISLEALMEVSQKAFQMQTLPIYPASERDWTLTLKDEIPIYDIIASIKSTASDLLETVTLLDIYRSEKLGVGQKNVTLRFVYRDNTKTIGQEAVDAEHRHITTEVSAQYL
jgi:phenylalanyl-tRNA synthetase beta chain